MGFLCRKELEEALAAARERRLLLSGLAESLEAVAGLGAPSLSFFSGALFFLVEVLAAADLAFLALPQKQWGPPVVGRDQFSLHVLLCSS